MERKLFIGYVDRNEDLEIPDFLKGRKFVIAVAPAYILDESLTTKTFDKIKEALDLGCVLGQRGGISDKCLKHRFGGDPHHGKNSCLYHPFQYDMDNEKEGMELGRLALQEHFDTDVDIYNPLNHLWRKGTLENAEETGFKFFMDRNQVGLRPYTQGNITVLPEGKIPGEVGRGSCVYSALGNINNPGVREYLESIEFVLPGEIETFKVGEGIKLFNKVVKNGRKILRDARWIIL